MMNNVEQKGGWKVKSVGLSGEATVVSSTTSVKAILERERLVDEPWDMDLPSHVGE